MSRKLKASTVTMIPIEKINILNPRVRNKRIFSEITDNIAKVGLKRPITLTRCNSRESGKEYDLVCGQGRLEAFIACGQTEIPAIIIDADEKQALIMSLVENCARRRYSSMDLMQGIGLLKNQGYDAKTIAQKTGLGLDHTNAVLILMEKGEERLLTAVETGQMAMTVAMTIANTPDENMQQVLQEIYESKQLRGNKFMLAKKLIDSRRRSGKALRNIGGSNVRGKNSDNVSVQDVMKIYQKEIDRKRLLTRKAEIANSRLLFIMEALRRLLQEEHFNTLLRAESLSTLPKPLADLLSEKGYNHV